MAYIGYAVQTISVKPAMVTKNELTFWLLAWA